MKVLKTVCCIAVSIFLIIYLIVAPDYIMGNIKEGRKSFWETEKEPFTGIINVWHIVGFKAHTGSVSSWLGTRANEFEKKHFGVFISVSAMTIDEYLENVSNGKSADIYSFPLGLEYSDLFYGLDESKLACISSINASLLNTGKDGGMLYAIPYMYSGYCLALNTQKMSGVNFETPVTAPEAAKLADELSTDDYNAFCADPICAAAAGIVKTAQQPEQFKAGNAHLALCDFRLVGDLERRSGTKTGFSYEAYSVCDYTDLVQYIALNKNIDNEKLAYCYEFMDILLGEQAQTSLCALNAYPAVCTLPVEELKNKYSSIAYDAFSIYLKPRVPNCFLYKRNYDALYSDAQAAQYGESDALIRFNKRLAEILGKV